MTRIQEVPTDSEITKLIPTWKRVEEPDFVKLYLQDIGRLWDLSKKAQELFGELVKMIEYSPKNTYHNYIELTARKRKMLIKALGIQDHLNPHVQLGKSIKALVDAKLLIPIKDSEGEIQQGMYLVDPNVCSKANWAHTEIMQAIKLEITYSVEGRTLITHIEENTAKTIDAVNRHRGYFKETEYTPLAEEQFPEEPLL